LAEQGSTYAQFIERQADAEYDRRSSLDARGLAIVTSSGAFTTLLFAVLTALKGKDVRLTGPASGFLIGSLVLLVLSALADLYATQLVKYTVTDVATLRLMLAKPHWRDEEADARGVCAHTTINTVESLRTGNDQKAGRLVVAVALQLAAFIALTVTVITSL